MKLNTLIVAALVAVSGVASASASTFIGTCYNGSAAIHSPTTAKSNVKGSLGYSFRDINMGYSPRTSSYLNVGCAGEANGTAINITTDGYATAVLRALTAEATAQEPKFVNDVAFHKAGVANRMAPIPHLEWMLDVDKRNFQAAYARFSQKHYQNNYIGTKNKKAAVEAVFNSDVEKNLLMKISQGQANLNAPVEDDAAWQYNFWITSIGFSDGFFASELAAAKADLASEVRKLHVAQTTVLAQVVANPAAFPAHVALYTTLLNLEFGSVETHDFAAQARDNAAAHLALTTPKGETGRSASLDHNMSVVKTGVSKFAIVSTAGSSVNGWWTFNGSSWTNGSLTGLTDAQFKLLIDSPVGGKAKYWAVSVSATSVSWDQNPHVSVFQSDAEKDARNAAALSANNGNALHIFSNIVNTLTGPNGEPVIFLINTVDALHDAITNPLH